MFNPSPSAPATPGKQDGEAILLNTKEWVDLFYQHKAQVHGGKLNPKTQINYRTTIGRFAEHFEYLPLGLASRDTVFKYIHRLKNLLDGKPLLDGTKKSHVRQINTFYHWLKRNHHYEIPDLTGSELPDPRPNAVSIRSEQIRTVLGAVRNHTEYTLVLLFAQTGCRMEELCTIRPECLHDHWVDVWGKPTKNNLSGYRPLPIPSEAYKHLRREFDTYGELVMMNQTDGPRPLAHPPEAADPRTAIDLLDPATFRVRPRDWSEDAVKGQLNRLLVNAGVYRRGMGAHSFRRNYEGDFVQNGGDSLLCDRILGHFSKSDMKQLYLHRTIEQMVEYSEKYAPRSFLGETAAQGEMPLGGLAIDGEDLGGPCNEDDGEE